MSSGDGIRTHVTGLMRPGWNRLQSTPQSQRQDSNLRYRAYEARLDPSPVHSAKIAYKKTAWILFLISSAVRLSLTKVFCFRAIHHSFIRLPPDRMIFLGIIIHGETDILLTYAEMRRIFISLIIIVLLITSFLFFTQELLRPCFLSNHNITQILQFVILLVV